MAIRVYHLKPLSAFHLGEATGAMDRVSEIAHSDTVFSGLCHAWGRLYGTEDLSAFLKAFFKGDPPLRLSSAFPYRLDGGKGIVYYLPWPLGGESTLRFRDRKSAKKATFIPLDLFVRFFADGREVKGSAPDNHPRVSEEEEERIREEGRDLREGVGVETRVCSALCRRTMSASPYFLSVLRLAEGWGLYLLLEGEDNWLDKAEGALRLLGDIGLGGDRSSGCGGFRLEPGHVSHFESLMSLYGKGWMALSLVYPGLSERKVLGNSRLSLLERKGWIDSHEVQRSFRKKRTMMIAEGSVLSARVMGELVDVTPESWPGHRIYRYGIGFYLPVVL